MAAHRYLQLNAIDRKSPMVSQITLESMKFAIAGNSCQIPLLVARVLLNDIGRFTRVQLASSTDLIVAYLASNFSDDADRCQDHDGLYETIFHPSNRRSPEDLCDQLSRVRIDQSER